MKKAGELLASFFDEKTLDKAQGYSKLSSSWVSLVTAYKIPAAADHSRIVELERHVLLIEADHPGWIQILQTKQRELLSQFQRRFPDLAITGISFRLSRGPVAPGKVPTEDTEKEDESFQGMEAIPEETLDPERSQGEKKELSPYESIKDDDFRETLKRLEQEILLRNRAIKKKKS
jgi:hypothetical protein